MPSFPILEADNQPYLLSIGANPELGLGVQLLGTQGLLFTPPTVWIYPTDKSAPFTVQVVSGGIHTVIFNLVGPSANDFEIPDPVVILAFEGAESSDFTDLDSNIDQLAPGCCSPGGQVYQCPGSLAMLSFPSVCYWVTKDPDTHVTGGIVFVSSSDISLPLSIAGLELNLPEEGGVGTSLPTKNQLCSECFIGSENCYYHQFNVDDIAYLLKERALGRTFLNHSSILMPEWLTVSLQPLSSLTTEAFASYDYINSLVVGNQVSFVSGCGNIQVLSEEGLYIILRYRGNVTVTFDNITYLYSPSEDDLALCIAIDVCQGSTAPVHISIPTGSQDTIREFPQFQEFVNEGWQFEFYEALVSTNGITMETYSNPWLYWNGRDSDFNVTLPNFDLRMESSVTATFFTTDSMWITFSFSGDLYHQAYPTNQEVRLYTVPRM